MAAEEHGLPPVVAEALSALPREVPTLPVVAEHTALKVLGGGWAFGLRVVTFVQSWCNPATGPRVFLMLMEYVLC